MSSPARRAGRFLVLTSLATLWLLGFGTLPAAHAATGDVTEFSNGITGGSQPWAIAAGPDGNLWFTETKIHQIGRITPTGGVHEFSNGITSTLDTDILYITNGPDGNLWFTERKSNKIGRITPSGVVTEFTIPTVGRGPFGITAGPDGNLWFTERDADRIGRITPSGTIKEFHTGITPGAGLWGITAGPDGRLWFTESQFNTIGAITTTGTVTEYSPPELTTPALGITPGPDGNLWFAQNTQVGRITTAGAVQQFTSGFTTGGNPNGMFGIATGSDGNLWAMEGNLDKIARITTAGTVQEFSSGITSGSGPQEGTAGPDGNLWFTEVTGNRIGRAAVAPTGTTGVLARDFAFTPKTRKTPPGSKVKWMFEGPNPHSVADTTGLNSFHTGSHSFVTYFSKTFNSAGTFTYHCTLHPTLMKGAIAVSMLASPASGSTSTIFTLTWSTGPAPSGLVFDVQIKRPGSSSFANFKAGVTAGQTTFHANRAGTFAFRARLRKISNGTHSGWSPTLKLAIS